MKKIFLALLFIILLTSCTPKEEEKVIKKEDPKKIVINKIKEETLKEYLKFDKDNTRTKVETLTWFLCFNETINIPFIKLSIDTKNCKQEKWDDFIYFKAKWNSLYKFTKNQEELIIKMYSKFDTSYIWDNIKNDIIFNFKNILDKKYCSYVKLIKKDFLKNDLNKESYIISPNWFYKTEANDQMEKDPNTLICEWYYPNKKIILYDIKQPTFFLEIKLDKLINLDTLNFN